MFAFPTEAFGIGKVSWPTDVAVPAHYPRVARIRHATRRKKKEPISLLSPGSFHYFITCSRSDPF